MKNRILIGLVLLCTSMSISAQNTIVRQIQNSNDDAEESTNSSVDTNNDKLELGKDRAIGLRFSDILVPIGANISSAYIEFVAEKGENKTPSSVVINGEANSSPSGFASVDGDITGRVLTGNSVNWAFNSWTKDQVYSSPDISAIIQELVDSPSWVQGSSMAFVLQATGSKKREAYSIDKGLGLAPKLVINYTGGLTSDILNHLANDLDLDPTNEYNTQANLTGTDLKVEDGGGTLTVDLSSLEDSAEAAAAQTTADQAVSDAANAQSSADAAQSSANAAQQTADQAVSDASLAQSSADNAQFSADAAQSAANQAQNSVDNHIANDLDTDATNEFNNSAQLIGNELQITDGGGTLNVDLSAFENEDEVDPEVGANELNKVPVWNGSELVAGTISMVNTTVSAPEASAIGSQTVASGLGAFASGFRSTAAGINSFAIGSSTQALNNGAVAMGIQTVASGLSSLTAGFRTEASGVSSTALGVNSKARSWGEIALGINNTDYGVVGAGPGEWHPTDRLLVVGNGTNANNPSDAFVILKNGNTGIGTSTPEAKLDVTEDILVHGMRVGKGNGQGNYFNTAVGIDALSNNTSGQYNAAFGFNAMFLNSTGTENTATGYQALMRNTEGGQNTAVGLAALAQNTTASSNTAVGYTALGEVTTGGNNTAVGSAAMVDMFEGYENVAVGAGSMIGLNNGSRNTAVGTLTGHLSQGSGNIFLGHRAGYFEAGDNKLYIDNSDTSEPLIYGDFDANQLKINGAAQIVNALTVGGFLPGESAQFMEGWDIYTNSNRMSISESGVQERITIVDGGNVGFSTVNPQATVDVNGNLKVTDGTQGSGKVLTSDADGFASWQTPVDEVNDADSDPFNELQDWNTLPGIPGDILDGDQVEDADANPFNESNIEANLFGTELHILDNAGIVVAELAPLKDNMGDHSATQILRMNNQPISNDGDYEGIFINNDGNVGINTEADNDYSLSVASDGIFSGAVVGTGGVQGNTRVGFNTMNNTTGFTNSAFGESALQSTTSGFDNTGAGVAALAGNTTGSQNSALGVLALEQSNGEGNTALGYASGTNITTGNANTFIGRFANASSGDLQNVTAIGHGALAEQSNTVVLGNFADVGIGTGAPTAKLDVRGNVRIDDGSQQAGYVLTSDASGFASWQENTDNVNDADSDPFNELQDWNSLPGIPGDILDGDQVDDADADPNNELQLLSLSGDILSISDGNQIEIPGLSQIVANANLSVQDRLDNGETPAEIYQSDNGLLQDLLGKNYQGGVIFQFDPATGNGLIARPEVVAGGPWGCFGTTLLGAGNTLVGSGLQNTLDIDVGCNEPNIVAKTVLNYSHDGYNDWFLPSKDELELCLQVLRDIGFSPQFNTFIWTSSEVGSTNAWRVSIPGWRYTEPLNEYNAMNTWSFSGNNKQSGHNIIPVRAFTSDENLISQHIAGDSDLSSENELNTAMTLNGTVLELTDNGGTLIADLAGLQDGVDDADSDPTNEIQQLSLDGNFLSISGNGGNAVVLPMPESSNWTKIGDDIYSNNSGSTGIGTSSPDATLDVEGTFQYVDGNQGEGKVLVSDAFGNARWETISSENSPNEQAVQLSCPVLFNQTPYQGQNGIDMVSHNGKLFVVTDNTLEVYDNSGFSNQLVSSTPISYPAYSIAAIDNYVYVSSLAGQSIYVYDLSDPTTPVELNSISTNRPVDLIASDSYLYVLRWAPGNMDIYDLSNPSQPILESTIDFTAQPTELIKNGNFVYVVFSVMNSTSTYNFATIDVSNSMSPVLTKPLILSGLRSPFDITLVDNTALYIADRGSPNIQFVYLQDPANPSLSGTISRAQGAGQNIGSSGKFVYTISNTGYLEVFEHVIPVGLWNIAELAIAGRNIDFIVEDKFLYVLDDSDFKTIRLDCQASLTDNSGGTNAKAGSIEEFDPSVQLDALGSVPVWNGQALENSLLFVENDKIGIGHSNPKESLHISRGTVRIDELEENQDLCRALYVDKNGVVYYKNECNEVENESDLQNELIKRDMRIAELEAQLELLSEKVDVILNKRESSSQSETLNDEQPWIKQNSPNPFYNETSISYFIPVYANQAEVIFYDQTGRLIQRIELTEKGKGELKIKGGTLTPGSYIYKLVVDGIEVDTKKSVFIR